MVGHGAVRCHARRRLVPVPQCRAADYVLGLGGPGVHALPAGGNPVARASLCCLQLCSAGGAHLAYLGRQTAAEAQLMSLMHACAWAPAWLSVTSALARPICSRVLGGPLSGRRGSRPQFPTPPLRWHTLICRWPISYAGVGDICQMPGTVCLGLQTRSTGLLLKRTPTR